MTDLRKAAEMALKAFEKIHGGCGEVKKDNLSKHSNELATLVRKDCIPQIKALRQALAQPKREWVGLTDEEKGWCGAPTLQETVSRVEAKLKEKNT